VILFAKKSCENDDDFVGADIIRPQVTTQNLY